jgi:hypothetical protein
MHHHWQTLRSTGIMNQTAPSQVVNNPTSENALATRGKSEARKALEKLAKSDRVSTAIVFFLFFARLEYALKESGYRKPSRKGDAQADWNRYAKEKPTLLAKIQSGDAFATFTRRPPQKQIISHTGKLEFAPDNHGHNKIDLARLFVLLCRVRNNLFHGAKLQNPTDDITTDEKFLSAGITIMEACLDHDGSLKSYFDLPL